MTVQVNRNTAPIALRIEFDARPGMFNLSHTCTAPFRALIYAALGFDLGLYAFICFSTPAVRAGGARPAAPLPLPSVHTAPTVTDRLGSTLNSPVRTPQSSPVVTADPTDA